MSLPAYLHPAIIPDNNSVLQLDRQNLDRLTRFQMRAALSIGLQELRDSTKLKQSDSPVR